MRKEITEEQITEVREELVDRFGALPVEAEHLLAAVRIRLHAEAMGFLGFVDRRDAAIDGDDDVDGQFAQAVQAEQPGGVRREARDDLRAHRERAAGDVAERAGHLGRVGRDGDGTDVRRAAVPHRRTHGLAGD